MRRLCWLPTLLITLFTACSPSASSDPRANAKEITELSEGTVFYLNDEQGTPVAVADARGAVLEERAHHAYGAELVPVSGATPWSYVGNELDATELGNFHARPYDARLGRFLAVDPEPLFTP